MINRKNIFLATLALSVSLFSVSAMAMGSAPSHDQDPGPTPTGEPATQHAENFHFDCTFTGGSSASKTTGWSQSCTATGNFIHHHDDSAQLNHEESEKFKVLCDDISSEEGQANSCSVYDGGLHHNNEQFDGSFHGDAETDPNIALQLGSDWTAWDGTVNADMNFNQAGYNYDIPGQCVVHHDDL